MAKAPSPTAIAVIAVVRFTGPKKVSNPIANFSMAAAAKTGARTTGTYALYTISAATAKISTPQCRTKNTNELLGLSTSNPNRKNRRGKRSAARPAPAVIIPEATSIHPMDDANIYLSSNVFRTHISLGVARLSNNPQNRQVLYVSHKRNNWYFSQFSL